MRDSAFIAARRFPFTARSSTPAGSMDRLAASSIPKNVIDRARLRPTIAPLVRADRSLRRLLTAADYLEATHCHSPVVNNL
jgi:hypothetical protein